MSNSLKDQLVGLGFKAPAKAEPAPRNDGGDPRRKSEGRAPERTSRPGERRPQDANERQAAADARRAASGAPRPDDRRPPRADAATRPSDRRPPRADAAARANDRRPPRTDHAAKPRTREEMDLAKAYAIRAQREKDERIAAEAARQEEARVRREAKAKLAEFLKDKGLNDAAAEIARHFPYGGKIKRVHVTEAQLKALNAGELGVVQDGGRYVLVDAATLAEAEAIFPAAIALKVDPDAPVENDPYADPRFQVPDDLVW
jgi:uncharacterized protein YaiL (DUF2058 family)